MERSKRIFKYGFMVWIIIFACAMVSKTFQNDTFYTIKIVELIFKNGIDMMDHFSFHTGLAYTYPHWLYDCFIYVIYKWFGYTGLYISSMLFFIMLLAIVLKINIKNTNNYVFSALGVFICAISMSAFITARAQLVSYILFAMEVYFIETFLRNGKKRYLVGLLLISLILCNIHVAVWPFYFIVYLPYLAEYVIAIILSKIKLKKENKFIKFLKSRVVVEKNNNIKLLFLTMLVSTVTGLLTPIGDTPYTYLIKTMMGNSQKYIDEHQAITWRTAPFPLIIFFETIILTFIGKGKLRDLFMVCGLMAMCIMSVRHIALLALLGTICFTRTFSSFLEAYKFDIDFLITKFFNKKIVIIISFVLVIVLAGILFTVRSKHEYVDSKIYPIEAVKFIKKNLDYKNIRLFNEYNYGSYLLLNDIPVFIDSRADLYTKQFSGFDYDIFDDFEFIMKDYYGKFDFYNITHIILHKDTEKFCDLLKNDISFNTIYEDEYFIIFERLNKSNIHVTIK